MPLPRAAAHPIGAIGHAVQHFVYLRHDVLSIHHDRLASRGAQCNVQHRASLGEVDPVAAEHGLDVVM